MKYVEGIIVVTTLILAGCGSSGVMKMGPDTYCVSYSSALGPIGAKKGAYAEASKECSKQGKELLVINERSSMFNANGLVDLTFRCLVSSDPEMQQRPDYVNAPDILIQDQRQ